MNRSIKLRLHEWAAENFKSVQYPKVRPLHRGARLESGVFKYKMKAWQRAGLALISLWGIVVGAMLLALIGVFMWALISAVVG